jgi:hypothetical protein
MIALQRSVQLLEVSATGPELHLDVSARQKNVLLLEVFTLQRPEEHSTGVSDPHWFKFWI